MQINSETRFSMAPSAPRVGRSRFPIKTGHLDTCNFGDLVPVLWTEMLPGDTFSGDVACLARTTTPVHPVMGDAFQDVYAFFVPNRIIWDHWEEFCGANKTSYWTPSTVYTVPQMLFPSGGFVKGSLADHLGVPIGVEPTLYDNTQTISQLPFRAYAQIFNDWFKSDTVTNPTYINKGDATITGNNSGSAFYGGQLCKVAKYHDFFTSCLPSPQRASSPVTLGLSGNAVVKTSATEFSLADLNNVPLYMGSRNNSAWGSSTSGQVMNLEIVGGPQSTGHGVRNNSSSAHARDDSTMSGMIPTNLYADMSNISMVSVNDLRLAFATQRYLEALARCGGSKYIEILNAIWGVSPTDARLQRAEYLGGRHMSLNCSQVPQTAYRENTSTTPGVDNSSPVGTLGAYSQTSHKGQLFKYSAQEDGILMILTCFRTQHVYQQGIYRGFQRKDRLDYYIPQLANISEQPVFNNQIYVQDSVNHVAENKQAFGYQEAWSEYRFIPRVVSGAFRSAYAQSLDAWHYADYYAGKPTLSESWLNETTANVDRTLYVPSSTEDQVIMDWSFKLDCIRPMPVYSVPGLIDHH